VKSNSLSIGLVVLGVVFLVIGVLYAFGVLQIFVTDPHAPHHYTHLILFVVLAVAAFIAANFTRERVV
jgi:hypothetical protein